MACVFAPNIICGRETPQHSHSRCGIQALTRLAQYCVALLEEIGKSSALMVSYPIYVKRSGYSGRDPKKLQKAIEYNRVATMLEEHINAQIKSGKTGVFLYSTIAREVGLSIECVREILFSVDCGHNGFTVSEVGDQ